MDLLLAGLIFATIFAVVAGLVLSKGGGEQKEFVSKMMLRPAEGTVVDVDITRKRKDHQNAVAIILRQINLLKNLEQTMWQAGMYWRGSAGLALLPPPLC